MNTNVLNEIQFSEQKEFTAAELQQLFLSVQWSSGSYPEKLVIAMQNSSTVFSAWHNGKLIGLITVLDDGAMTAYVHYLLVNPVYHKKGIGRKLVQMIKAKYADYLRIVLVAYEHETNFYTNCGFAIGTGKVPMFITSLWT